MYSVVCTFLAGDIANSRSPFPSRVLFFTACTVESVGESLIVSP